MAQNKSARNEFGTPQVLVARIASPPDNIVVNRVILPPDSRLHRCHSLQWSGDSFNPGRDLQSWEYGARFSSFKDDAGQYVPWLYAAGSLQGALAETVFHDLIGEARTGFLSLRPFRNWGYTELASTRKLQLASLKSQDLYRMGTSKADLIESGRLLYTQTRLWARAIYLQHSDIDGLVWKSRQHDDSDAFVLFGDRVKLGDLRIASSTVRFTDDVSTGYEIQQMAQRLGVILSDE